jgi:sugar lactone lactonase YvrE
VANSRGANGLAFDGHGNLVACEGDGRAIARYAPDGTRMVLASTYRGRQFNSPNDLWIDATNGIYFTDPRYGAVGDVYLGYYVYYLAPGAREPVCLITNMVMPNGIIGTPDGTRLYVADWGAQTTYVYDIVAPGVLANQRMFAPQRSDGLDLDDEGNVYLTGGTRGYLYYVTVYDATGRQIDRLGVPENPTNLAFSRDGKTMFITAGRSLYAVRLATVQEQRERISRFRPFEPPNKPVGVGRGIVPGRVAWAHDPQAARWQCGDSNSWCRDDSTDPRRVAAMLSAGLRALTGQPSDAKAWQVLFAYNNYAQRRGRRGYAPGEKVAVKLNCVQSFRAYATPEGYVSIAPQLVRALLHQLVYTAGVAQADITLFDSLALIDDHVFGYCTSAFPKVHFADYVGQYGRARAVPASNAVLRFACAPGSSVYLPRCVADAAYLINLAAMKTHQIAGFTACAKNHFGSFCEVPAFLHKDIDAFVQPRGTANPLVELIGHKDLGGKTMLYLLDGLYGGEGWEGWMQPWRIPPFLDHWPASLLLSQDPVAIDSVAFDLLGTEFAIPVDADNYLHEAALAQRPPSGTVYDPEGDGRGLRSLGVHEHWNNARSKKYSRNLGRPTGIELLYVAADGAVTNCPPARAP